MTPDEIVKGLATPWAVPMDEVTGCITSLAQENMRLQDDNAALLSAQDNARALLTEALQALRYADFLSEPKSPAGCDCLICRTITKIKGHLNASLKEKKDTPK